ncbi:hypothetical protein BZA77DRAFT_354087 [Pyronema omphalodes]|nr:hypothetical protein BZA77DRAFT_354087 [Pyronema omphalodes]
MSASAPSSPSNRPRKRHSTSNKNQYPQTVMKNGRKYFLDDKSHLPYPLPCDIKELSRQTLWHELSRELWGGYSTINWDVEKLPDRVLDLGCGTGIWSAAMNEDFLARGKRGTEFVGMDLMEGNQMDMRDLNWKFVKHNFLETPFPFEAESFDFVFMRDIMLGYPSKDMYSKIISEVLRIIKPGGLFEIQCNDYIIRTLSRPSTPAYIPGTSAYEITSTTQFLSVPENPFISTYNSLITSALVKRDLPPVPCTLVKASFLTEDGVSILSQRRFALPFDQIWWESTSASTSSGSDGSSDADSKASKRRSTSGSSVDSFQSAGKTYCGAGSRKRGGSVSASSYHHHHYSGKASSVAGSGSGSGSSNGDQFPSPLTDAELALRHLVRLLFVQLIEALEPMLRDAEGMELDEWDSWYRELMWNWFEGGGLRGGECMEFGAWYGKKKVR